MNSEPALPDNVIAAPGHPGWYRWDVHPGDRFAGVVGPMIFRARGDGTVEVRMWPTTTMLNLGGSLHGGAAMTFIDMALFVGGRLGGMPRGQYVTLDCATHFVARTMAGAPLDAIVRIVGQTHGGMIFLSGHCEQDGRTTHSFTGTLKKIRERV
ncbi:MAG: PaaI family thioesterase [Sphingomicrobium sp.]